MTASGFPPKTHPSEGPPTTVPLQVPASHGEGTPPPWLAPFRYAVVRLATFVEGKGTPPRLVFATLELLAPGRPSASSGALQDRKFGKGANGRVFFRRVAMGAAEAVAWYEAAARGDLTTPIPADPSESEPKRDGIRVGAGTLTPEPPWPDLVLPLDGDPLLDPTWSGSPAPFIGSGASPARVSRLFSPPSESLTTLLLDEAIVTFLKPRLHVDLFRYPEYLGGMVLIAPDPIAREVRMFVRPRPDNHGVREDIVVHVLPREGSDLSDLEVTLIEIRAGALHRYERTAVPKDGLVVWQRHHEVVMSGFMLTHATQGVLRYQAPTAFLRRITLTSSTVSRRVSIRTPTSESPDAREETYGVTEYARDRDIEVGPAARQQDRLSQVYEAEARRRRLAAAENQGQRWLDNRDVARTEIRRILEGASHRVWIADPYLGGRQIFQFIHAVSRLAVEIRLITSRLAFEGPTLAEDKNDGVLENLDRHAIFTHGLQSLKERGFADVETWVLRGKSPPLHDRFLVVDNTVWFSGNSLNALGARAGLILKVPDPHAIVTRLAALRHKASSFEDYLSERSDAKAVAERHSKRAPSSDPGAEN
ncbi:hypothetical protein C8J36_110133 [Rhizobium sp. PP-F2F-G48]|uniref:VPA1262 family N-terminal domain-containing protein n=1 Tax=Rhizobium sp. PP-F2F-G48 TaxID=2135651 RepID=UPI0010E861E1|nr:VPA1262 family N-terminal domain-containing protein [Rhizobium sp. PP-F2F-G48]TCM51126.1 hypothetical protein C8J36_110133 [Rhizobium sp. PP-F2F-G48]